MSKSSLFEQMGSTYSKVGDYYLPNLTLPDDGLGEEAHIGIWGMRWLNYLKKHKRVLYSQLLRFGKLRAHLHEIDTTAYERWERMIELVKKAGGVTESQKTYNDMKWMRRVNSIRSRVEEIIRAELIYN